MDPTPEFDEALQEHVAATVQVGAQWIEAHELLGGLAGVVAYVDETDVDRLLTNLP